MHIGSAGNKRTGPGSDPVGTDRIGRRKPVIFGGAAVLLAVLAWVLYGVPEILRGPAVGILMGIASGAAMIPYSVIKEANPPELGGSATGVINFLNFTFSALLGPVFGSRLVAVSGPHAIWVAATVTVRTTLLTPPGAVVG